MIQELEEKRRRLHAENTALLKKAKDDGRDILNPDEETEWQGRDAAIETLTKNIEMRRKQDRIEATLAEAGERRTEPNPVEARGDGSAALRRLAQHSQDFEMALRGWFIAGSERPLTPEHTRAAERVGIDFRNRVLTLNLATRAPRNVGEARRWEERAQTVTTSGGGYTIPDEMMRALEVALLWYGPMRQVATILRTETGADLPIPTVNDTNHVGRILDINTQVQNQDVAFGQLVLHAFKYSSDQVLVPVELMQDNAINLPQFLGEALGERIGRIQNTHFTIGAGTTLPFGIVTRAAAGPTPTGSVAAGFKYVDMVDLEHSVDIAYRRQGAAFMCNDVVVARLKKLLDTAGRPIWQPADSAGMMAGAPNTLLGYPIWVNNDMATATTTGTKAVLFGALGKYLVRDVLGITLIRLDERYADYHQVAFLAIARADGDLLNAGTNPVKVMAYTT